MGRCVTLRDAISLIVLVQICYMTYNLYVSMIPNTISLPHIVVIIVDDLRPQIGCYGWQSSSFTPHTPNLDQLSRTSVHFSRVYAQQAMCAPSRASFLTSRRPDTTRVYNQSTYFRTAGGNFTTLPQYFKLYGYETVGMGKVFHGSPESGGDDPLSWSVPYYHPATRGYWSRYNNSWIAVSEEQQKRIPLPDDLLTSHAVRAIEHLAEEGYDKPLFLAIGYYKPHLPLVVPQRFLDLYPIENISLADNGYVPSGMPQVAWNSYSELRQYRDIQNAGVTGDFNTTLPDQKARELRRAYYAAVTYIDEQIGSILSAIHRSGIKENTVVAVLSDNGYHLGEHAEWTKNTNFEQAARVPLFLRMPGLQYAGVVNEEPAELVDLFPTIVNIAGLPALQKCPPSSSHIDVCTEGTIMRPFTKEYEADNKNKALTQAPRLLQNEDGTEVPVMGYSLRTSRFRYSEWVALNSSDASPLWGRTHGMELYDHRVDPEENINIVNDTSYAEDLEKLQGILRQNRSAPAE